MSYSWKAKTDEEQLQDVKMRETKLAESLHGEKKTRYKNIMHLWEFLLELLADESCKSLIAWSRQGHGEFKLKNQEEVAKRWGQLKNRPSMNYEKLSRALRHYYNQGIIKKVPGQRLVYKFHKLPYEYTPGKTRATRKSLTRTQDGHYFKDSFLCGTRQTDDSERLLTDKDRMRRLLREKSDMTTNLDKPTDPKQKEQECKVSPTPNSLELPSMTSLPCNRPVMSNPVHPAVCCYGCSLRDVKRLCYSTRIMYPVSAYKNVRLNGWNYHFNTVPVSVITRRY